MTPLDELQADLRRRRASCEKQFCVTCVTIAEILKDTEHLRPLIEAAQRVADAQQALSEADRRFRLAPVLRAQREAEACFAAREARDKALNALLALLPPESP